MKITLFSNKKFLITMLNLAIPIILQELVISSLNFIDVLMIGQLNETSIAAVGISNQIYFIFILTQFGITGGAAVFISQYWGKRDMSNIHKVLGLSFLGCSALAILFMVPIFIIPERIIRLFSTDKEVIRLGGSYLFIVGISYLANALTFAYSTTLKSIEKVRLPMVVSFIAIGMNVILNYLLIFGKFGFPQLGVKGAAIGTCISRLFEAALLIALIYIKKYPVIAKLRDYLNFDMVFIKRVFKTSWPVMTHHTVWSIGISIYHGVYARIGTEAIAAVNIAIAIENIIFVIFLGMTIACSIMVGNKIGANEEETAYEYALNFFVFDIIGACIMAASVILLRSKILGFYNLSDVAYDYAYKLLLVNALFFWAKVSNMTLLAGIFRGGADTTFSMLLDIGGVWIIGIPLAFVGAFVFHLPVYWVVSLVLIEDLVKLSFGLPRFLSGKWIKNVVKES